MFVCWLMKLCPLALILQVRSLDKLSQDFKDLHISVAALTQRTGRIEEYLRNEDDR